MYVNICKCVYVYVYMLTCVCVNVHVNMCIYVYEIFNTDSITGNQLSRGLTNSSGI